MNIIDQSKEALDEQLLASLIRIGFAELERCEIDTANEWLSNEENMRLVQEAFDGDRHRLMTRLRRAVTYNSIKRVFVLAAPRVLKLTVATLLIVYLGFTVAFATVKQVREFVYKLFTTVESEYTEFNLGESPDSDFSIPPEWNGSFFPQYIPDGFDMSLAQVVSKANENKLIMQNSDGLYWLVFYEFTDSSRNRVNTEGSEVIRQDVGGVSCVFAIKESEKFAAWTLSNRYFLIWTNVEIDEIFDVIQNVKSIN